MSLDSIQSIPSLQGDLQPKLTSSPTKLPPTWTKGKPLRIININCQSLVGKKGQWSHLLTACRPDVIIATETWLSPDVKTSELECDNYAVYRRDRTTGLGGGVLIAISSAIKSTLTDIQTNSEILWVKINCKGQRDILVGACYRPIVSDKSTTTELFSSIEKLTEKRNFDIFLGGDFNYPGWNWTSMELKNNTPYVELHRAFSESLMQYELKQLVTEPTRCGNTLDLMITNIPSRIVRTRVIPGISDHDIPLVDLSLTPLKKYQVPRMIKLYNRTNWKQLNSFLEIEMEKIMAHKRAPTDQLWTSFKSAILEAEKKFVPTKKAKRRDSCPWVSPLLRQKMEKRDHLRKDSTRKGHEKIETRYKALKRECQRIFRHEHNKYVDKLLNDESERTEVLSKRFWTYVKHRRSECSGITAIRGKNALITDSKSKADALNRQFQSVFTKPSSPSVPLTTGPATKDVPSMPELKVGCEGVRSHLRKLNPHKAGGPDGISPRLLRETADTIAPMLTRLFNTSLMSASVPEDWRKAHVSPIYKKGDRYKTENYRPVSLTCICSKVFEHIITCHLMRHLEGNNLLYPRQHGFRAKLSCETQLTELISDISAELDKGREVDAILLDFSKAFDRVNHHKLVYKLKEIGVSDAIATWVQSFLNGRTQRVVLEGALSESCPVSSGVPQGSVLGPLLFLVYINDLPKSVLSSVRLFADDTIIYDDATKSDQLQEDLRQLELWEKAWDMSFHPAKCEVIRFTRRRGRAAPTREYILHNQKIPVVSKIKYLGVHIQNDLKWSAHIDYICGKAASTLGFIKRTLPPSSKNLRAKAFKQLERPILEYASCSWDPLPKTLSDKVEAAQRRAARAVFNVPRTSRISTTTLLNKLDWVPLAERREHRRICLFRAMHFKEVNTELHDYIKPSKTKTSSRKHSVQYSNTHHNTKSHLSSFFVHTAKLWNNLDVDSRVLYPPG